MQKPSTLEKDRQFISDIIEVGKKAQVYVGDLTLEQFILDEMRCLAVTRLIEIAGEASSRISPSTKSKFPEVQWREMADTRNKAIHGYSEVDYRVIYDIALTHLPAEVAKLELVVI